MRKTYFDILVEDQFQDNVKRKLLQGSLTFRRRIRKPIPLLYKYRALSEYSLNDIKGKTVSFSRIDIFNDVYDSSLHNSYSKRNKAGLWQIEKDFFLPAFVGTYASCFSELNDSILMWAHYGDCSRGICIEYDFRLLSPDNLLTKALFPIAYTKRPIDFSDWLDDDRNAKEVYPIDSAVLCASLNKSTIWEYEKEVRLIDKSVIGSRKVHIEKYGLKVSKIIIGYKCEFKSELVEIAENLNVPVTYMNPDFGNEKYSIKEVN